MWCISEAVTEATLGNHVQLFCRCIFSKTNANNQKLRVAQIADIKVIMYGFVMPY